MSSAWGLSFGAAWADAWGVVLEDEEPIPAPRPVLRAIPDERRRKRVTPAIPLASLRPVDHAADDEDVLLMIGAM